MRNELSSAFNTKDKSKKDDCRVVVVDGVCMGNKFNIKKFP